MASKAARDRGLASAMQGRRARVLWVTEEPPSRDLGGGNIRQSYLFAALASAIPTDLLVAAPVVDPRVRKLAANVIELPAHWMPHTEHPLGRRVLELAISIGSPHPASVFSAAANRRALARAVRAREHMYDVVLVEHEALAPLLSGKRSATWVITFHHVLSAMLAEELRLAPGRRQRWFRARDLAKAERLERRALQAYERCIACSDQDAERLRSLLSQETADRLVVIPNGVDLAALRPTPVPPAPRVLLPGTLSWGPNVDGATWFCKEVWPLVRAEVAGATLVLAGRSPSPAVVELGRIPGVSVEADVPSMRPHFEAARVVVVPLRVGTGTRIKALEAMAAGRPVVGTQIGLEGIGIQDQVHACVADGAGPFAAGVIELLKRDSHAEALARAGRDHVERHFGWDRVGAKLVEVVSALLDEAVPPQAALRSSSNLA